MQVDLDKPQFRSGTAARLAKMPTATLRIWERRYGVTVSPKSSSGQRLYSRRDIDRLALLRALVNAGHAIGSVAPLNETDLRALADAERREKPSMEPVELVVAAVGFDKNALDRIPAQIALTHYASIGEAIASATALPADIVLVREANLLPQTAQEILALADRSRAAEVLVVYLAANDFGLEVLRFSGAQLLRERGRMLDPMELIERLTGRSAHSRRTVNRSWCRSPHRYTAEQLEAFISRSALLKCECPQHLTALVKQISAFESYSDRCASDSSEDALMHRYLGNVAARARALFEQALEHFEAEGSVSER